MIKQQEIHKIKILDQLIQTKYCFCLSDLLEDMLIETDQNIMERLNKIMINSAYCNLNEFIDLIKYNLIANQNSQNHKRFQILHQIFITLLRLNIQASIRQQFFKFLYSYINQTTSNIYNYKHIVQQKEYFDLVVQFLQYCQVEYDFIQLFIRLFKDNDCRIDCLRVMNKFIEKNFNNNEYWLILEIIMNQIPDQIDYGKQRDKLKQLSENQCKIFDQLIGCIIEFLRIGFEQRRICYEIKPIMVNYLMNFCTLDKIYFEVLRILGIELNKNNNIPINYLKIQQLCISKIPNQIEISHYQILINLYQYFFSQNQQQFIQKVFTQLNMLFKDLKQLNSICLCLCLLSGLNKFETNWLFECIHILQNIAQISNKQHRSILIQKIIEILSSYPQILLKNLHILSRLNNLIQQNILLSFKAIFNLYRYNLLTPDLLLKIKDQMYKFKDQQIRKQLWNIIISAGNWRSYKEKLDWIIVNRIGISIYKLKWQINWSQIPEECQKYPEELKELYDWNMNQRF